MAVGRWAWGWRWALAGLVALTGCGPTSGALFTGQPTWRLVLAPLAPQGPLPSPQVPSARPPEAPRPAPPEASPSPAPSATPPPSGGGGGGGQGPGPAPPPSLALSIAPQGGGFQDPAWPERASSAP